MSSRSPRRSQRRSLTPATAKTAVALRPSDGITPTPKERHSGTTEEEAEQRQRPLHAKAGRDAAKKGVGAHEQRLSEQAQGYSWLRSMPPWTRWMLTHNLCIPAPKDLRNAPD